MTWGCVPSLSGSQTLLLNGLEPHQWFSLKSHVGSQRQVPLLHCLHEQLSFYLFYVLRFYIRFKLREGDRGKRERERNEEQDRGGEEVREKWEVEEETEEEEKWFCGLQLFEKTTELHDCKYFYSSFFESKNLDLSMRCKETCNIWLLNQKFTYISRQLWQKETVAPKGCLSYNLTEIGKKCEWCYHSVKLITYLLGLSLSPLTLLIAFFPLAFLSPWPLPKDFKGNMKELQPHGVPYKQVRIQGCNGE